MLLSGSPYALFYLIIFVCLFGLLLLGGFGLLVSPFALYLIFTEEVIGGGFKEKAFFVLALLCYVPPLYVYSLIGTQEAIGLGIITYGFFISFPCIYGLFWSEGKKIFSLVLVVGVFVGGFGLHGFVVDKIKEAKEDREYEEWRYHNQVQEEAEERREQERQERIREEEKKEKQRNWKSPTDGGYQSNSSDNDYYEDDEDRYDNDDDYFDDEYDGDYDDDYYEDDY